MWVSDPCGTKNRDDYRTTIRVCGHKKANGGCNAGAGRWTHKFSKEIIDAS